jgi:hypothetical protein
MRLKVWFNHSLPGLFQEDVPMQYRRYSNAEIVVSLVGLLVGVALGSLWYFCSPTWRSLDHIAATIFGLWNQPDRLGVSMSFSSPRPWMNFSFIAGARAFASSPQLMGTALLVALLVFTKPLSRFMGGEKTD